MSVFQKLKCFWRDLGETLLQITTPPQLRALQNLNPVIEQLGKDMANLRAIEARAYASRAELEKRLRECFDPTIRDQLETVLVKMDGLIEIISRVTGTPYVRSGSIRS